MEITEKLKALKALDTKSLIEKLHQYEDELEKAMIAEADFKSQSHGYLGSGDCSEVKRILAELVTQAPEEASSDKKRETWLQQQRKENKELNDAIMKQRQVAFLVDDHQIKVEMAKKRLESIKAIIALKTAQINFLASN